MPRQTSNTDPQLVPFAQLWPEEQRVLAATAAKVPPGGLIVEIGCAQGGSSVILARSAPKAPAVRIFSVDMRPAPAARERLREAGVTLIEQTSLAVAREWQTSQRGKADLLLIDGDHSFEGALSDFEAWRPHLKPGATVMFHDVDPEPRGGCAHFAIRVFIQTLLRERWLDEASHQYRYMIGTVGARVPATLPVQSFAATLGEIVGSTKQKVDAAGKVPREELWRGISEHSLNLTSLDYCILVDRMLESDYHFLQDRAAHTGDFRRWTEVLLFLDYGYGGSLFSQGVQEPGTHEELSRILAREQVRIGLLLQIVRSLVTWQP